MKPWRSGADVLRERLAVAPRRRGAAAAASPPPEYVAAKLARAALLHDVPFAHLVPDADCCRPSRCGSSRSIARGPTRCSTARSRSSVTSAAAQAHPRRRAPSAAPRPTSSATPSATACAAARRRPPPPPRPGGHRPAAALAGRVAVPGHPGARLQRHDQGRSGPGHDARRDQARAPEASLLGTVVLLALFDGTPSLPVVLEEPRTSVQLGLIAKPAGGFSLALRGGDGNVIEQANTAVTVARAAARRRREPRRRRRDGAGRADHHRRDLAPQIRARSVRPCSRSN